MGKIYKNKKASCNLCKPFKCGWEDKKKPKHRDLIKETDKEISTYKGNNNDKTTERDT